MRFIGSADTAQVRRWGGDAVARLSGPVLFARALLARYRLGLTRIPLLDLLPVLRARPHLVALHLHADNRVNRFAVTLHSRLQRQETGPGSLGPEAPAPRLQSRTSARRTAVPAEPVPPPAAATLRRLIARGTRAEAEPGSPTPGQGAAPRQTGTDSSQAVVSGRPAPARIASSLSTGPDKPGAGARPVRSPEDLPTVRSRPQAPALATGAVGIATADAAAPSPRTAHPAPAPTLSPPEIERIAEQVIGSIDRRIIAERERRGRV